MQIQNVRGRSFSRAWTRDRRALAHPYARDAALRSPDVQERLGPNVEVALTGRCVYRNTASYSKLKLVRVSTSGWKCRRAQDAKGHSRSLSLSLLYRAPNGNTTTMVARFPRSGGFRFPAKFRVAAFRCRFVLARMSFSASCR